MSSTSPNFNLVIATQSDTVNVVTQIANNFTTLDSILSRAHTGTGELKAGLQITNWTATNLTIVGTVTAGSVVASTGRFTTITASGGALVLNSLSIGTYAYPSTIGATGALLTVVTGNAVFVSPSGGTGANTGLSNLASVAINTSINTFTGGFATLDRVIATSGALSGLTTFQATTGTFAGNLAVTGTVNASAINVTGGAITGASIGIGTWSLPTTIGLTGQVLTVTTGNAQWLNKGTATTAYVFAYINTDAAVPGINAATGEVEVFFNNEVIDSASIFNPNTTASQLVVTASGYYQVSVNISLFLTNTASVQHHVGYVLAGTRKFELGNFIKGTGYSNTAASANMGGTVMLVATSGDAIRYNIKPLAGTASLQTDAAGTVQYRSYITVHKIPDV